MLLLCVVVHVTLYSALFLALFAVAPDLLSELMRILGLRLRSPPPVPVPRMAAHWTRLAQPSPLTSTAPRKCVRVCDSTVRRRGQRSARPGATPEVQPLRARGAGRPS